MIAYFLFQQVLFLELAVVAAHAAAHSSGLIPLVVAEDLCVIRPVVVRIIWSLYQYEDLLITQLYMCVVFLSEL
jgi:hypothetical protein